MKRARVAYGGAIHEAYPHADGVCLADGRVVSEEAVVWLAPFEVGTIIALGLNYADHVKELSKELTVTAQDEPLAFLKAPSSVIGHRAQTRRPDGVGFMHYECELAVVIGRTAKQVKRKDAMAYVAGYTVANDYAIRDYLENYYRPNLRVKNRDRLRGFFWQPHVGAIHLGGLFARVDLHPVDLALAAVGLRHRRINHLDHDRADINTCTIAFDIGDDGIVRHRQGKISVDRNFLPLGGHFNMLIHRYLRRLADKGIVVGVF